MSATSATSGITASLSTSPIAINGTSTLTVNVASSVAPGAYSVTVNGMSGSQAGQNNHSISIPVTVTGGGGTPDFTLSANPASVSVAAPGSGTTTIMVNPIGGFNGSVSLSASGLPTGVTVSFNPASTTTTSVLTFSADSTAMAGKYPLTVTGVSGSLTHTTAVSVIVGGSAGSGTYLSNLSLSALGIKDNETSVATVTLNRVTTVPITVSLQSSDTTAASVPGNVTIPANSSSATFIVSGVPGGGTDEGKFITLLAFANGRDQSQILTVVNSSKVLTVNNLEADGGRGCIVLSWSPLPLNSVKGYRVFRRSANQTEQDITNGVSIGASIYADSSVSSSVSYDYRVAVETWGGVLVSSDWITSSSDNTAPALVWSEAPSSTNPSRRVQVSVPNTADLPDALLIVDGSIISTGQIDATGQYINLPFDVRLFGSGTHVAQVIACGDSYVSATAGFTFQNTNSIVGIVYDPFFDSQSGEVESINGIVPAGTASWTVNIRSMASGAVLNTVTGDGSTPIHFSWQAEGAGTNETDFSIEATATGTNGVSTVSPPKQFKRKKGPASVLILISKELDDASHDPLSNDYDHQVGQDAKNAISQRLGSGYGIHVLEAGYTTEIGGSFAAARKPDIIRDLKSANVFYALSHGNLCRPGIDPSFNWGGLLFKPLSSPPPTTKRKHAIKPSQPFTVFVDKYTTVDQDGVPQYGFVWVDTCQSFGGDFPDPNSQNINSAWKKAFKISATDLTDFDHGCFMGWNGAMFLNTAGTLTGHNPTGLSSTWFRWREDFWRRLGQDGIVSLAISTADGSYGNNQYPPSQRLQRYGDALF